MQAEVVLKPREERKVGEMMVKNLNHLGVALAAAAGALAAVGMLMLMLVLVEPAGAAFPGQNGKIAFVRNHEIYTMNADGTGLVRLTNNTADDDYPAWSPDLKTPITGDNLIAFSSDRDGNDEIYTINPLGTKVGPNLILYKTERLTNDPAQDFQPAWSPDGKKIAFSSLRNGQHAANGDCLPPFLGPCNREIYTMNANGTGLVRLTNNPTTDHDPAWSPDGTKIAFTSNRNGNVDIYTMNADGTGLVRLTRSPNQQSDPVWSPDGTKIAFTYRRAFDDGDEEIYTMNANGSFLFRRTNSPYNDNEPSWSPDGKKIAFTSHRDDPHSPGEIYTMNANGTGLVRLTNNTAFDSEPDWQPLQPTPTASQ